MQIKQHCHAMLIHEAINPFEIPSPRLRGERFGKGEKKMLDGFEKSWFLPTDNSCASPPG